MSRRPSRVSRSFNSPSSIRSPSRVLSSPTYNVNRTSYRPGYVPRYGAGLATGALLTVPLVAAASNQNANNTYYQYPNNYYITE